MSVFRGDPLPPGDAGFGPVRWLLVTLAVAITIGVLVSLARGAEVELREPQLSPPKQEEIKPPSLGLDKAQEKCEEAGGIWYAHDFDEKVTVVGCLFLVPKGLR